MSIKKQISALVIVLFIPIIGLAAYFNQLWLFDTWRMLNYDPPAEVVKLADDITLRQNARRLFYVYRPAILDNKLFNMYCRENEYTIVLGCYRSRMGIYIFDVQDERLSGIKQVTAAHEYLHAVYERLDDSEKARINQLTKTVAANLTSQRLKDTINLYETNEPESVPNELHSILGTELRVLPSELEEHYAKYFSNRLKIVEYSEAYEKAFDEREKQIDNYDQQLQAMLAEINRLKSELDSEDARLDADRSAVESSQSQSVVNSYNRRVELYNQKIESVKNMVAEYNEILAVRNNLVLEEKDLAKAIDSRDVVPKEQ